MSLDIGAGNLAGSELFCPDVRLLKRCARHDMAAWDALVRQFEIPVFRLAYALSGNADAAAEIAARVFVDVFNQLPTFRIGPPACFGCWLLRLVVSAYSEERRDACDSDNPVSLAPVKARLYIS